MITSNKVAGSGKRAAVLVWSWAAIAVRYVKIIHRSTLLLDQSDSDKRLPTVRPGNQGAPQRHGVWQMASRLKLVEHWSSVHFDIGGAFAHTLVLLENRFFAEVDRRQICNSCWLDGADMCVRAARVPLVIDNRGEELRAGNTICAIKFPIFLMFHR